MKKAIILSVMGVAVAAAGVLVCQRLFFATAQAQVLTGTTSYGSFATTIEGTGTTVPADSVTYTTASDTEITAIYVAAGDTVAAGDLLYTQDSSAVTKAITAAQGEITTYSDSIADYQAQLTELGEEMAGLTVTAPISGRLTGVTAEVGDTVRTGDVLATLTDDGAMTLTQYFSYAFEDQIYLGQSATVSVPDLMTSLIGTVADIRKVDRVTTEGTRCFAVTVAVENPGALTGGMSAGGYLLDGGTKIYPAVEGTLENAETKTITAQGSGDLVQVNATDYQTVAAGATLFVIDDADYQSQVKNLNTQIQRAQEKITTLSEQVTEAQDSYADYQVCSQLAGKVIMVGVREGDSPQKGRTAVMIYDLTSMSVSVNVDELDIDYVTKGMTAVITRSGAERDTTYEGIVTEVGLEATSSGGVATFPVTITIDSAGALSAGVSVAYTLTAGDAGEGVLAPVAAIQYSDEGTCVFVQSETQPETTVELEEGVVPEGFWAVPVEVGTSSGRQVRILSGVEQEATVFLGYQQTAPQGGDTTSEGDGTTDESQQGGFPSGGNMPSMPSGGFSGGGGGGNMGGERPQ